MKVVFADDNTIVLRPIPKGKPGRKKKESNIAQAMRGDKEAFVTEIVEAIVWARELTPKQWSCVINDVNGGLRGFVSRAVEAEMEK